VTELAVVEIRNLTHANFIYLKNQIKLLAMIQHSLA
jgi:hypothetical protein